MTGASARWTILALLVCASATGHQRASAQEPVEPTRDNSCQGPVISHVFVDNHTIYDAPVDSSGSAGWTRTLVDWGRALANRVHRRTRRSFIEDELLFRAGECFDNLLIDESARLLRDLPFIADADVYPVHLTEDEVHVVVDTRDDWTLKLDVRSEFDDGLKITRVAATEENLWGTGTLLGFYLVERDERRDLGLELRTPRFAGTRADAQIAGGRTRTGVFFQESLTYPFVGEVGEWAFFESYSLREDLFRYAAHPGSDFTNVSLPVQTRRAATTLGRRFGTPGDLTLVGAGMSWEDVRFQDFPGDVTVVTGFDFSNPAPADSATVESVRPHVNPRRLTRVHLVAGKRNIGFIKRRGLDAVRGEQDIRVGTQAVATIGTTIGTHASAPGSNAGELRGHVSLFGGAAGDSWVFNSELNLEAARRMDGDGSDAGFRDVLAEVGAYFYWQPAADPGRSTSETPYTPVHTFVVGITGAGGWNNSLPFQLTLGGPYGVRGYDRQDFPAAKRILAHVEDRIALPGPFRDLFDLGLTLFVDAGAGWKGEVPFGADSQLQGAAGAGLRLGFPAGARQVLRLDLAVPMHAGGWGNRQFRVGYDAVSLLRAFGDQQMRRSRGVNPAAAILGGRFNR